MDNTVKIAILNARKRLLLTRGPHNTKIVAKISRKIRALQRG